MKSTEERKQGALDGTFLPSKLSHLSRGGFHGSPTHGRVCLKIIDGSNCPVGSVTLYFATFAAQRFGHSSVGRVPVVLGSFDSVGVFKSMVRFSVLGMGLGLGLG